jgi:hypothetical protein
LSRSAAFAAVALPLLLSACDPGTVSVRLLDYDPAADAYDFRVVEIETLDDLHRLDGRATTLVGDAELVLDYQTNLLKWKEPGRGVAFAAIRSGGALVPEDFDSLAMVSIYYQIERSLLFFEDEGFDSDRLVHMETYYWPKFTIVEADGAKTLMVDNAFYLYATTKNRAFYVFPYEQFGWLPLSMNGGVMTHEFSHAVYDALVTEPNRAWIDGGGLTPAASNFVYGLNEGVADVFAVARLGDPDFMSHSIAAGVYVSSCNGGPYTEIVRDASAPVPYTAAFDLAARNRPPAEFCPYDIGMFVSGAVYAAELRSEGLPEGEGAAPSAETQTVFDGALLRALDRLGQSLPPDFELYDLFELFVEELPAGGARDALCTALEEQYAMYYSEITGC